METASFTLVAQPAGLEARNTPHIASSLYAELWVSLASLLRSYTALHGLNRFEQATVELGEECILVRAAQRWLKLDRYQSEVRWARENGDSGVLQLTIDGRLKDEVGNEEELDMQAESWARELMQ